MKKSLKAVISCGVAITTILSSCATTDKGSEESKPQTPGKRIIRTVTTEQKVTKVQKDGQKDNKTATAKVGASKNTVTAKTNKQTATTTTSTGKNVKKNSSTVSKPSTDQPTAAEIAAKRQAAEAIAAQKKAEQEASVCTSSV